MDPIKVPKTPRKAFNPARRPSALLLGQIKHLEWAALLASQRKPNKLPKRKPTTEGQAAEYIAQLTDMVVRAARARAAAREQGIPEPAQTTPVKLPPLPKLPKLPKVPTLAKGSKVRKASKPRPGRARKGRRS